MNRKTDIFSKIIVLICVLALAIVIIPLLVLGHFDYPSADDWSYSSNLYHLIKNNASLLTIVKSETIYVFDRMKEWEPRYMDVILSSISPACFGNEHYYRITPYIMIFSIIFSNIIFFKTILNIWGKNKLNCILPIVLPVVALELLCNQFPEESIYWYEGAINYTFIFSLSLIHISLFLKIALENASKKITIVLSIFIIILSIIVGGDNYATSVSQVCVLLCLDAIFLFWNKKAFKKTWWVTMLTFVCTLICLVSPGNAQRVNASFGGTTNGVVWTIGMSLWRTLTNIYSWTAQIKILLLLLLVLPFAIKAVGNMNYNFKLPGVVTVLSYCIYATQIVATMYVDGNTGGGRMAAILYFAYHVWLITNFIYWVGWFIKKKQVSMLVQTNKWKDYLFGYFLIIGLLLSLVLIKTEMKGTTTYKAFVAIKNGYAQEYADIWEERLEVLNDESIKECYFAPVERKFGTMIIYCDLGDADWVKGACAMYYDKECIYIE